MYRQHLITYFLICLMSAATGGDDKAYAQTPVLKAGVAVVDITPSEGYSQYRGASTGTHDPLHAKAIVFQQGSQRAALVICDLISITRGLSSEVRVSASQQTGIAAAHIVVTGTHTHTGPAYRTEMEEYVRKKEAGSLTAEDRQSYSAELIRSVTQAVVDAAAATQPVQLQVGAGEAHGIAFNRRFVMKDGSVRFNPGVQNPDIVRAAGPTDPAVQFLMIRAAEGGEPQAGLTVFANHTDTAGGTDFSADYPYHLSQALRQVLGDDFVSVFGMGTSGDINHIDVSLDRSLKGHEEITGPIGEKLAATVQDALPDLREVGDPDLAVQMEVVYAPLQEYTDEELAWAKDEEAEPLYPERSFLQTRRRAKILSLEEKRKTGKAVPPTVGTESWTLPLEVQVIRLGEDTAIVTLPGEVFVELGLAIKEGSPFENTMVIELANSNIAYVPTRKAFSEGSYETVNSRVAPGGGEMMVETALQMLEELK